MRILVLATTMACICAVPAFAEDIPADLLGHWAIGGACDRADDSIRVEAGLLSFGAQKGEAVEFFPNDSPSGNGAIHWTEEGVVDNFEYDATQDVLLHNGEGYGMGAAPDVYKRCKS
jgi:hypothetical protein